MDEWVAAEIERQLQGVSVDEAEELSGENGGEELGLTESSQLMEHSQVTIYLWGDGKIVILAVGRLVLFHAHNHSRR